MLILVLNCCIFFGSNEREMKKREKHQTIPANQTTNEKSLPETTTKKDGTEKKNDLSFIFEPFFVVRPHEAHKRNLKIIGAEKREFQHLRKRNQSSTGLLCLCVFFFLNNL